MDADREENLKAQLSAYLDGELSEEERAEVQAWVEQYADARALLDELRATVEALGSLPRAEAPGELLDGLRSRLERRALLDEPHEFAGEETPVPMFSVGRWLSAAAVIALSGVALYFTWSSQQEPRTVDRDRYALVDKEELARPAEPAPSLAPEESRQEDEKEEFPSLLARASDKDDELLGSDVVIERVQPAVPIAPESANEAPSAMKAKDRAKETPPPVDQPASVTARYGDTLAGGAEEAAVPAGDKAGESADATDRMVIRHDLSLGGDNAKKPASDHGKLSYGFAMMDAKAGSVAAEAPAESEWFYDQAADIKETPAADVGLRVVELAYANEADVRETLDRLEARFTRKAQPVRKLADIAASQPADLGELAAEDADGNGVITYEVMADQKLLWKRATTTAPAGKAVTSLALKLPNERAFDEVMDTLLQTERRPTRAHILGGDRALKSAEQRDMQAYPSSLVAMDGLWDAAEPTTQPAASAEPEQVVLSREQVERGRIQQESDLGGQAQDLSGGEGRLLVNGSAELDAYGKSREVEARPEESETMGRSQYATRDAAVLGKSRELAETKPVPPESQPVANQAVTIDSAAELDPTIEGASQQDVDSLQLQASSSSNVVRLYVYIDQPRDTPTTRPATTQPTTQPATQPSSAPAQP